LPPSPFSVPFSPLEGTDKIKVRATAQDDLQLKRWLLSLGMEAEVREPVRLRREIAEEMREALRAYDA
jgi:predicted DNA-binding transcriptional regulator YafY